MKYAKMLGLVMVAALFTAALGGVGSASATVLCKQNVIPCQEVDYPAGTTFHATLESETSTVFRNTEKASLGSCTTSTIEGTTNNTGGTGKAVEGKLKAFTLGGCTFAAAVPEPGQFQIEYVAGTNTLAALTLIGTKVTVSVLGLDCIYGAGTGIDVGDMTGGKPATIDINAAISKVEGSPFCPASILWEGKYVVTVPEPLYFKDA